MALGFYTRLNGAHRIPLIVDVWTFNEGASGDRVSSLLGTHMVEQAGAVSSVASLMEKAAQLNGTKNLYLSTPPPGPANNDSWSIYGFFKANTSTVGTAGDILGFYTGALLSARRNATVYGLTISDAGSHHTVLDSGIATAGTLGTTVFFAIVVDNGAQTVTLRINADVQTVAFSAFTGGTYVPVAPTYLLLGGNPAFEFDIDELGYTMSYALTSTDLDYLYNAGSFRYFNDLYLPRVGNWTGSAVDVTCKVVGGPASEVYSGQLYRYADPSGSPTTLGTAGRTGPGPITITDTTPPANTEVWYEFDVNSTDTGVLSASAFDFFPGSVQTPSAFVWTAAAVPDIAFPNTWAADPDFPKIGLMGDSRAGLDSDFTRIYQIIRASGEVMAQYNVGGTTWHSWNPSSGTGYLSTYLAAAAGKGTTHTIILLDVNSNPGTFTDYQTDVQAVVTALVAAGQTVIVINDPMKVGLNGTVSSLLQHKPYLQGISQTGTGQILYTDYAMAQAFANHWPLLSVDGVHWGGTYLGVPGSSWAARFIMDAVVRLLESVEVALTAGTITSSGHTDTTAALAVSVATGGTAPYTYQWYRSLSSGFTPGGGNILSGQTGLTLNDTGLTASTTYYYKVVVTDNVAATATSVEFSLTTNAATTRPFLAAFLGYQGGYNG